MRKNLFIYLTFALLIFSPLKSKAEAITYTHTETRSQGNLAAILDDGIMVYGPKMFMKFDDKFSSAHFSGPHGIKGYGQYIKSLPNGEFIIAGVNYGRKGFLNTLTKDSRQNFIARISPKKMNDPIEYYRNLDDRVSEGLEINHDGNPVLLSSGGAHYTLTIFSKDVSIKKKSTTFGVGQDGSLAITPDGHYIVVGFEDNGKYVIPTYWEFSSNLKLIKKETLGTKNKRIGNLSSKTKVLTFKDDVYVVYGWEMGNTRDEQPDEIHIKKIKGKDIWKNEQELPYHYGVEFYMSPNGTPYALYPRVDNLYKVSFRPSNGKKTKITLNRPTEPVQCFPPKLKYEIIDVLQNGDKNELIVFNGDPLNHHDAGCVAIGKVQ